MCLLSLLYISRSVLKEKSALNLWKWPRRSFNRKKKKSRRARFEPKTVAIVRLVWQKKKKNYTYGYSAWKNFLWLILFSSKTASRSPANLNKLKCPIGNCKFRQNFSSKQAITGHARHKPDTDLTPRHRSTSPAWLGQLSRLRL